MTRSPLPGSAFGQRSMGIREPVLELMAFIDFLRKGVIYVNELVGGFLNFTFDLFTLGKREFDFRERYAISDFVLQHGVDGGQVRCRLFHFFVHLLTLVECPAERRRLEREPRCGRLGI